MRVQTWVGQRGSGEGAQEKNPPGWVFLIFYFLINECDSLWITAYTEIIQDGLSSVNEAQTCVNVATYTPLHMHTHTHAQMRMYCIIRRCVRVKEAHLLSDRPQQHNGCVGLRSITDV